MKSFIDKIPKAELHIHIEGSLEPELMFKIAERNGIALPYKSVDELKSAYNFHNLQSFLDIYYQGADVLMHEKDFYDMTWAYLTKASDQNILHTEIFFDPQTHTQRGVAFETVISGIYKALSDAREKLSISSKLIMCFLRHLSPDDAMNTLHQGLEHKGLITAVGLDSSELGFPPDLFIEVFSKARKEGFLTVAHAGEEGPPDYIWQAVNNLKASRIDHGVRCLEDPGLIKFLVEKQIPLTVCPLSNVKLNVFNDLKSHNLKELIEKGVCATVNSDDPAYFGGYLNENLLSSQNELGLSRDDIYILAKNSFNASFITDPEKESMIRTLDLYMKQSSEI